MVRFLVVALAAGTQAFAQQAEEECLSGTSDALHLVSWSAELTETGISDTVWIETTVRNNLDKGVRMVDGRIYFEDVLGRQIVNMEIDADISIGAGETATSDGTYYNHRDIHRLPVADKADIKAKVCVDAVVFDDGVIRRFDED